MDLATLDLFIAVKGDRTQPTDDVYIASVEQRIKSVSANAEKYMARKAKADSYVEKFTPTTGTGTMQVQLQAYPVSEVESVKVFDSVLTSGSDFSLDAENGIIHFAIPVTRDYTMFHNAIEVSYTGGMATDSTAFVEAYPNIATEVCVQVAFELARQKTIADKSTSNGQVSTSHNPYGLLDSLKYVLDLYKTPARVF